MARGEGGRRDEEGRGNLQEFLSHPHEGEHARLDILVVGPFVADAHNKEHLDDVVDLEPPHEPHVAFHHLQRRRAAVGPEGLREGDALEALLDLLWGIGAILMGGRRMAWRFLASARKQRRRREGERARAGSWFSPPLASHEGVVGRRELALALAHDPCHDRLAVGLRQARAPAHDRGRVAAAQKLLDVRCFPCRANTPLGKALRLPRGALTRTASQSAHFRPWRVAGTEPSAPMASACKSANVSPDPHVRLGRAAYFLLGALALLLAGRRRGRARERALGRRRFRGRRLFRRRRDGLFRARGLGLGQGVGGGLGGRLRALGLAEGRHGCCFGVLLFFGLLGGGGGLF